MKNNVDDKIGHYQIPLAANKKCATLSVSCLVLLRNFLFDFQVEDVVLIFFPFLYVWLMSCKTFRDIQLRGLVYESLWMKLILY